MQIRPEAPTDEEAIHKLTLAAFEPMSFSNGSEAPIVRALRTSGDLTLSLVAEEQGEVIGHVAFSPVTIDDVHNGWFGLGPISVRRDRQRPGVGRALVAAGLEQLELRGARGCALIGDPDIYGRMGFSSGGLTHDGVDDVIVQYVVLGGAPPSGTLRFAPAFDQGSHPEGP